MDENDCMFCLQIDPESFVLGFSARSDNLAVTYGGGGVLVIAEYSNAYYKYINSAIANNLKPIGLMKMQYVNIYPNMYECVLRLNDDS